MSVCAGHMLQLNDIHGHVIETKPTERFGGSGGYKRTLVEWNEHS